MESAGRVLIMPKGAWDAQTEYHMLDAVRYQGSMYVAKRTNTNVTPVDGADWFLSAEGAQNGGHTIKDPSGTSFTQRDGLQFTDAKVTDDGTNDTTKIEIVQTETASEFENETADGLYNVTGEDDEFLTSEDIEYRTGVTVKQALDRHESSMAFVENGATSVGAYTAGQYIVHGDKFYEVKSTIAAGDTFTTGTNGNIEEKNIGQVITAINSNLSVLNNKIKCGTLEIPNATANTGVVVNASTISSGTIPQDATHAVYTIVGCSNVVDYNIAMACNNGYLTVVPSVNNNWIRIFWIEYIFT